MIELEYPWFVNRLTANVYKNRDYLYYKFNNDTFSHYGYSELIKTLNIQSDSVIKINGLEYKPFKIEGFWPLFLELI